MPAAEFEPANPAIELPQIYALERVTTEMGVSETWILKPKKHYELEVVQTRLVLGSTTEFQPLLNS
jgi:hypothetical protein